METKKCPHCKTKIDIQARICPQCNKDARSLKQRPLLLIFLAFMIFGLIMILATVNDPTYTPWIDHDTSIEVKNETPESYLNKNRWLAKKMCRDRIGLQLKSPSSSNFNNEEVTYTWTIWQEALVTWTVDAKNSFWVAIRNSYYCYFRWTWSTYEISDVQILN